MIFLTELVALQHSVTGTLKLSSTQQLFSAGTYIKNNMICLNHGGRYMLCWSKIGVLTSTIWYGKSLFDIIEKYVVIATILN